MKNTNNRNSQMSGNEKIINRTAQRRKRNRRKKLIIRSALAVVFLLVGIVLVLTMFFRIDEITVTGDEIYSRDEIVGASGVNIGDNLIFVSKTKISDSVASAMPYVGSVKIKRHLPSGLELVISKTEAVYALTGDGYFTLLDKYGKVLEKDVEYIGENITMLNLGEIISCETGKKIELKNSDLPEKLASITDACNNCGLQGISAIDMTDIYNIKLIYEGRITLELGEFDKNTLTRKLDLGRAAIETQNEENEFYRGTINLKVAGKGYWSEETSTTEPETVTEESTAPPENVAA